MLNSDADLFLKSLEFKKNNLLTIGAEVEVQIIERESFNLSPQAHRILNDIKNLSSTPHIKHEIFQSMLELDTPISTRTQEIENSLLQSYSLTRQVADNLGFEIMMSGTHPFARYTERLLTPKGRYFGLVDRNQWIARRLQIFGLHLHIGIDSGENAIQVSNALMHYLPVILAFSASSPFWHGEDTGLASSRITMFESIPTGGHPYAIESWVEFQDIALKLYKSRSITGLKDLWWDIRPNPEYGTIEIRIADCLPTILETSALIALMHSLAALVYDEIKTGKKFRAPPEWILRENKWRASRHGTEALMIINSNAETAQFTELWEQLKHSLLAYIENYQYHRYFEILDELAQKGPSYVRQRSWYHKRGDLTDVVKHLCEEGKLNTPIWD